MRDFIDWMGGRKWVAFLLMYAMLLVLVLSKHLTDQTIIRDCMLGLLLVYGGANVAHWATSKLAAPQKEQGP